MCRVLLMQGAARAVALQIMAMVAPCFREDEQDELYAEIYRAVLEGMQIYESQSGRLLTLTSETPN